MRIIKKTVIFIVLFYISLFVFFLGSKAFAPWCYEDEVYLFEVESQMQLIEKIDSFYMENEKFWYGEKISEYKTGNEVIGTLEYQYIEIKLENISQIVKIKMLKSSVNPCIHLESYFPLSTSKTGTLNKSMNLKKFNRLCSSKEDDDIRKEFETVFLNELGIKNQREKPSALNKVFAKLYLILHPQFKIE